MDYYTLKTADQVRIVTPHATEEKKLDSLRRVLDYHKPIHNRYKSVIDAFEVKLDTGSTKI